MPIHLSPLTRRQFLARSVAVTAGLAMAPEMVASTKAVDQSFWALLSDTHLAADQSMVFRGVNMASHLKTVAAEIMTLPKRPVGVIIAGDCAYNTGEAGDYATVKELLQPIRESGMPVHLALGNHDNRERFWNAFQEEQRAKHPVSERQTALLMTPRANWFILDSLEKTQSTPGLVGHEQLTWLAESLDAQANKPALVLVHHNPGIDGGNMGLKDTIPFLEVIRPRKQVKAYIFGHTHHWSVEQDSSGIHFVNLPPVAYVFREGEPSGWVHMTLHKNGMKLELRCADQGHKAHGQTFDLPWRKESV